MLSSTILLRHNYTPLSKAKDSQNLRCTYPLNYMSDKNIQEIAKQGDVEAISHLINQEVSNNNLTVEAQIQYGVTLWLKISSPTPITFYTEICIQKIIDILNDIQPNKIINIRISLIALQDKNKPITERFFRFKENHYIENAHSINQITSFILVLIIAGIGWLIWPKNNTTYSPTGTASSKSSNLSSRTFLGRSETGYELWADSSCVYVKNLRESDLQRLNSNISIFKEAVKSQTGFKCVLFE